MDFPPFEPWNEDMWNYYSSFPPYAPFLTQNNLEQFPQTHTPIAPSAMDFGTAAPYVDPFAQAAEESSQGRKRGFESTSLAVLDRESKSRRTTPVQSNRSNDNPRLPSSSGSIRHDNFIDLTGSDDEDDGDVSVLGSRARAPYIAAENQARQRHDMEQSDRILAIRSSQGNEQPYSSQSGAPQNAFHRMMETQRQNSSQARNALRHANVLEQASHGASPSTYNTMPGSFNPEWDDDDGVHATSDPFSHQHFGSSMPTAMHGFGSPSQASSSRNLEAAFDMSSMTTPVQHDPNSFSGLPGSSFNGFQPAGSIPRPLHNVINLTNGYDYINGVDRHGNPLPSEITDFVNHVVHDGKLDQKELDDLLANIGPDTAIPEIDRDGTPEGLKGALYRHQEIALTWLKKMEEGTNKGGILADDMGLGKTISILSLILSRPARSKPKTNLIIGPLSLLKQWEEEISSKVKRSHRLSVYVYHGTKKNSMTTEDLLKFDVVLTTYGTLASQSKRLDEMQKDAKEKERQIDYNDKSIACRIPMLHPKAKFYRIILDEAQYIKNVKTQSSQAVCKLRATYRWCLSGTPMMNSVEELFALIQFLRIKPYCNWHHFKTHFGRLFGLKGEFTQTKAMDRLRTVLKAVMLRRKKDSTINGKPILRLPPKTESIVHVDLSEDERAFYNSLENKSRIIFNKYLREGSVGKNYTNILVLLLRMRQACCHPHLNLDVEDRVMDTDQEMINMVKDLDETIVKRIKELDAFECPICYDAVQSPCFFVPCGHDSCSPCLQNLVDSTRTQLIQAGEGETEIPRVMCPVCRGKFDPAKCFSLEAFQRVHEPEKLKAEQSDDTDGEDVKAEDDDGEDENDDDSISGSASAGSESDDEVDNKGNLLGFVVADDFKSDSEDEKKPAKSEDEASGKAVAEAEAKRRRKKAKKAKRKNKGKQPAEDITADVKPSMLKALRHDARKNRTAYDKYMAYLRKTWLPSAKATECINLLKTIREAEEKTIIFSQWTLLLDLIEIGMKHDGFTHPPIRYDGSMSAKDRNDSATRFKNSSTANVILVSLKAGNAGLNLTAASRVIILDPFWNPYIEMQAVDRAYRIGQQREVQVHRILTTGTVEDRILELQNRKKEMIEAAMDENEGRKISRLTVNELKFLFNGD